MKIDDLISISQKFGSPIYVYDAAFIKSQYKKLTDAFSTVENLNIKYAVKALSNINIIKILNSLGSGLDTRRTRHICENIQEVHERSRRKRHAGG